MNTPLVSVHGCRVSADDLVREVEEYFASGVRVAPGDTVVDVGANIGAFALSAARRCEGDLRIFCFEPSPKTYGALEQNFQQSTWLKRTRHRLFRLGLGSPEHSGRKLSFYSFTRFGTNSTFDLEGKRREFEIFFEDRARRLTRRLGPLRLLGRALERAAETRAWRFLLWGLMRRVMGLEEVHAEISTLGEVLREADVPRIDLLKIDVEGLELDVLLGIDAATWPKIRQVVMETTTRGGKHEEIVQLLREYGLSGIEIQEQKAIDNGLDSVIVMARRPHATVRFTDSKTDSKEVVRREVEQERVEELDFVT